MNTKENILQAYGTTWAGNGSDQLPTPTLFLHPGKNWMVSTQGILNNTTSLEVSVGTAHNSLNYELQNENLFRSNSGLTALPYLYPDAVQADYVPWLQFRGGRTGNAGQYQTDRGPFTNENKTWDVVANLTKVWGAHTAKFGVYYQHSYKPQSIFFSFNGQINFTDDSNNPFDTGYSYANAATGVFNTYTQANKFSMPEWKYKNFELYAQDNWKVSTQAHARLRRAVLLPDAAVGHDRSRRRTSCPTSSTGGRGDALQPRSASAPTRAPAPIGAAWTRAHRARRSADARQHRRGPLHRPADAGLEPLQRRLPGRPGHQRPVAERQRVQGLAALRRRLRHQRQRARRSSAAAAGIFYDRPQGNRCSTWAATRRAS